MVLDTRVWQGFPEQADLALRTTAHRIRLEGVDLYFLANDYLNRLPDTFYPPYSAKGRDLVFFKPLVFQADSVRFLRGWFGDEKAVVHTHEPYYHYLLPAALRADPTKLVVSNVQSNMPIAKKVYGPEVARLFELLGVDVELPAPEPEPDVPAALVQYQQLTHLHYTYPPDHVALYELTAEHADLIDFLSPGQLDFYAASGTPRSSRSSGGCPSPTWCAATPTRCSSAAAPSPTSGWPGTPPGWTGRRCSAAWASTPRCRRSSTTPAMPSTTRARSS